MVNEPKYSDYSGLRGEQGRGVIMGNWRLFFIISLHTQVVMKAISYIFTFGSVSFLQNPPSHREKSSNSPLFTVRHTHKSSWTHTYNHTARGGTVECITFSAGSTDSLKSSYYQGKAMENTRTVLIFRYSKYFFNFGCLLIPVCTVWNLVQVHSCRTLSFLSLYKSADHYCVLYSGQSLQKHSSLNLRFYDHLTA